MPTSTAWRIAEDNREFIAGLAEEVFKELGLSSWRVFRCSYDHETYQDRVPLPQSPLNVTVHAHDGAGGFHNLAFRIPLSTDQSDHFEAQFVASLRDRLAEILAR